MIEKFDRLLRVRMPIETFERLPRHGAFKYEYANGHAEISEGWRMHSAVLSLDRVNSRQTESSEVKNVDVRPIGENDWPAVVESFRAACHNLPPLVMLTPSEYAEAAQALVDHARAGGDGPLIPAATLGAFAETQCVGACLVTLDRPFDFAAGERTPQPEPRLTWIFVRHFDQRSGVATALLRRAAAALHAAGHARLHSSISRGNDASIAFHWRSGFELCSDGFSRTRWRRRIAAGE